MPIITSQPDLKISAQIAIVTSLFNERITKKLEAGAIECLEKWGLKPFAQVYVPGAVEIPLVTKNLLMNSQCDAVIALGLIVRGETAHFDYVCRSVERGCSQLMLEFNKPVAFGVLTTEDGPQAEARAGGKKGNKGFEAAEVALHMLQVLKGLKTLS